MPVCGSGVMLGAINSPNGVSIGRPPAKSWPLPGSVWQRGAVADDREVMATFDLVEILLVDPARSSAGEAAMRRERQRTQD